jgi:hypothetical protein
MYYTLLPICTVLQLRVSPSTVTPGYFETGQNSSPTMLTQKPLVSVELTVANPDYQTQAQTRMTYFQGVLPSRQATDISIYFRSCTPSGPALEILPTVRDLSTFVSAGNISSEKHAILNVYLDQKGNAVTWSAFWYKLTANNRQRLCFYTHRPSDRQVTAVSLLPLLHARCLRLCTITAPRHHS